VDSPIGRITLAVSDGKLRALAFPEQWRRKRGFLERHFGGAELRRTSPPAAIARAIRAYFAGKLDALASIPVEPEGTDFQKRVWRALQRIAPGTTMSYGALARSLGMPGAARAVGAANRTNPIGIVIPCHRVIGSDACLTGYAGGLERKRWLLEHEGALGQRELPALRQGAAR
jgi:O-6-methylguanine DNA methyltransferase